MDVADVIRKANKAKKIRIFNPDSKDFQCYYDGISYLLKAQDIGEFPAVIALHIKKHLANHLLHKGSAKNAELELKKIMKKIEV
jgi:hypothetical protein